MTAPHYGKRNAGALTAASPGDTLHFNFASYNDSGDSEALTGFAVTDIEVFKNGLAATRATDSGYSLISDTGQIGDRVGLYRFSIQLFNTADDTGHYESGAWYQVAVDSIVIDGKTVRFWAGSFEIGEPRANIVQIDGDTGSADVLAKATNGAGGVSFSAGINMNSSSDTGLNERLSRIQSDVDTGLRVHIDDSDTGIKDAIADLDTGLRGILVTTGVNLGRIRGDTGGADRFYRYTQKLDTGGDATVSASVDTGQVNNAVWNGARSAHTSAGTFGQYVIADADLLNGDTGFAAQLGKFASILSDAGQIDTGTGAADTGDLANTVWNGTRAAHTTAGTFGEYVNADVDLIRGDTGGADRFYRYTQKLDTGGDATVSASVDTGQVNQAVWQTNAQRKLTVDTGIADQVWMQLKASYTADTGTFGEHLGGTLGGSATVDTGQVNQAVWQANAQRKLTVDTGIADQVWKTATAGYADDTGTFGELLRVSATTSVDTGQINQAVWQANAARGITAIADTGMNQRFAQIQSDVDTGLRTHINDLDTGLHDTLADYDTGMRALVALQDTGAVANAVWNFATRGITNVGDTGIVNSLAIIRADTDTGIQSGVTVTGFSDTGVNARLAAIEAQTAKLTFDTGNEILADIRKVNNITVQGAGDTGAGDTWRPV